MDDVTEFKFKEHLKNRGYSKALVDKIINERKDNLKMFEKNEQSFINLEENAISLNKVRWFGRGPRGGARSQNKYDVRVCASKMDDNRCRLTLSFAGGVDITQYKSLTIGTTVTGNNTLLVMAFYKDPNRGMSTLSNKTKSKNENYRVTQRKLEPRDANIVLSHFNNGIYCLHKASTEGQDNVYFIIGDEEVK